MTVWVGSAGELTGGKATLTDELIEGGAHVDAAYLHDEVDRGATVAAAVAVPALLTGATDEDGDRRCATGLEVIGVRARPSRRAFRASVWAEQLVGQCREVDRRQ
jgi:hypothetical protein